jgi:hypothetical protein
MFAKNPAYEKIDTNNYTAPGENICRYASNKFIYYPKELVKLRENVPGSIEPVVIKGMRIIDCNIIILDNSEQLKLENLIPLLMEYNISILNIIEFIIKVLYPGDNILENNLKKLYLYDDNKELSDSTCVKKTSVKLPEGIQSKIKTALSKENFGSMNNKFYIFDILSILAIFAIGGFLTYKLIKVLKSKKRLKK